MGVFSLQFVGCSSSSNQTDTKAATEEAGIAEVLAPSDFHAKLLEKTDTQLVDVRTSGEIAQGYIANAKFMDFNGGKFEEEIGTLSKDKPVFVYCAAGGRSGKACKMMQNMGFKEVYDLKGGMGSWREAGMEVVK